MKFAFFMMPLHLPSENPSLAFQRDIDLINYADELGYDEFWIGEHHSAGWETIPAPEMALAMAAATAKRIRLGTSVINLPFHHPFHVAERIAFLDHLTRGRAMLGVGPSNLPPDIKLFNLPPQDLRPMMSEALDIIVKLLESPEPLDYDGRFWQFRGLVLQLRSYQKPRLPLALATGGNKRSLELAGKYGMMLLSSAAKPGPGMLPLAEQWPIVEAAATESGRVVSRNDWRAVTYIYLADTREQAWADIEAGAHRDVHQYFFGIGGKAGYEAYPGQPASEMTVQSIAEQRRWIIGTPDDAIAAIERFNEETGGIGGIMLTTHEWVSQAKSKYSLELFARYVMPHFRGHTADFKRAWARTLADNAAGTLPPMGGGPPKPSPSLEEHRSNLYLAR
jgi:limonene 1,2-monooxygenase